MIFKSTVLSTSITGAIKWLAVKVRRLGLNDIQTPIEASPYGIDGNPVKNMIAIHCETSVRGESVVIGYLNKNRLADVGELRLFSTDSDGGLKTYLWLTTDGKIQLGGTADNAVRYSPLHDAMTQLAADINVQLGLIATGIAAAGGSYSPGNINIDISQSKIDDIQTP